MIAGLAVGDRHVSRWFAMDRARIEAFAEVTEDRQWIHLDAERAAQSPFGGQIAHGFLTLGMLSAMAYDALGFGDGDDFSINYGFDRVRFVSPVPAGSRLRGVFVLAERMPGAGHVTLALDVTMELEGAARPALVARWQIRLMTTEPEPR
ncbi:MaoC family dehydratase [Acuticoccus sp. MNP-M23]|uniref:MaoC family dehydratase n=1 Tax=Acuticoccus sp. MNP-M23 TaxID=3072793 RepID=UPI0028163FE4|nr:MaoC family dehydratase [Acuticoccus sp. MNP-M23]WMS41197.1 MaoC family dehydratase [Acuticoccus sp. MNP-M23]